MKIIIQKFGGTSVETTELREQVAEKIISAKARGLSPVVVISAMGRAPQPYATNTLISLVRDFCADCSARELDLLMSCGETISAVLMSQHLRIKGHSAVVLTGFQAGLLTDDHYGDATILAVEPSRIMALLENGAIPVVTGFQGITPNFEITTLGRGGSDLTAAALGAALKADCVEIYSDVDGIMTMDPKISTLARPIPQMTFEEIGEMVSEGARVLQRRCVALAQEYGVPIWVKSTLTGGIGSLVSTVMPQDAFEKNRVATSLAHILDVSYIGIFMEPAENPGELRTKIFNEIARQRVSLDLINISGPNLFFIVNDDQVFKVEKILENFKVRFQVTSGCAKLSIIGVGMRGTPGVMAGIQDALQDAGVEILHSTDSHITISCLIRSQDVRRATEALQKKFGI
ncbi:MAG: aspartate kinase [bacterium]